MFDYEIEENYQNQYGHSEWITTCVYCGKVLDSSEEQKTFKTLSINKIIYRVLDFTDGES